MNILTLFLAVSLSVGHATEVIYSNDSLGELSPAGAEIIPPAAILEKVIFYRNILPLKSSN